jgi:hypothetical protein
MPRTRWETVNAEGVVPAFVVGAAVEAGTGVSCTLHEHRRALASSRKPPI